MSKIPVLLVVLVAGCAAPKTVVVATKAPVTEPAARGPERLGANSPTVTPGGVTFTAPAGWLLTRRDHMVVLETPEPDSHVVVFDAAAGSADAAVAAAWAAYRPAGKHPVKLVTERPGRRGWDERRVYNYEVSPNEQAVIFADARRAGNAWTVLLVDARNATFGKRTAHVVLVSESLRPKGYTRESFVGKKAHPLDFERVQKLGAFVEASMKALGVPGVGLSLIDGGKVVWQGGFGVRELGRQDRVDADTLFIIASNTKALTTLLLARLVDGGKLKWDQPVTTAWPPFKLGDADTTGRVLIKHLVCACTGLPRQDLEWLFEFKRATPKSAMTLLGTMQPTTKLGEIFQYSNLLAAAGGYVAGYVLEPGKKLGQAYDDAMRANIFEPLGMPHTTFEIARALKTNHASPHAWTVDGAPAVAAMNINYAVYPVRPAGAAWSSVRDLSRYVQLELGRGVLDGKRIVSEENLLARRATQVTFGEDTTYGMGLEVDTTWGVPIIHHGGSMIGYKSDMMFLPDYGVGAVILTNADEGGQLLRPFMRRLVEVLFDGREEAAEDLASVVTSMKARVAKERTRLTIPPDAGEAAKLAPKYHNDALGDLTVLHTGATVTFDFGEWSSKVASRSNDDHTTSFITIDPGSEGFELVAADRAGKRALIIRDAQHEYAFTEN